MIKFKNVSKVLSGKVVLKDFSFEISKGETLSIIGLSGSGKTTALKLIAGLHLPDSGSVYVNDLELKAGHLFEIRKKIGYVIQDGGLFPHLTARENISIVGSEAGLSPAEVKTRTSELSRMTKLSEDFLDRYPRELSGGQRQRIGIIRALLLDPQILLLDEPMGALDPITRQELQTELKELFLRLKKTVVLVTHDLFEARYLTDRIILIDSGSVVQEGSMKEFIDHPATDFVRRFVNAQRAHVESV